MILDLLNVGQINDISALVEKYKNLNLEQSIAAMKTDGVAEAEMRAVLAKQNYTQANIDEAIATYKSNAAKEQDNNVTKKNIVLTKAATMAKRAFNIAATAAIGIVVSLIATKFVEWLYNVVKAQSELNKTMDDSIEKVESLNSEIKSINQELEETEKRIDELNAKDNLSFVEQEELENLKKTNEELDRELKYKQALKKIEEDKLKKDADSYFSQIKPPTSDEHNYSGDYYSYQNYMAGNTP